jgi:hypothetical protein
MYFWEQINRMNTKPEKNENAQMVLTMTYSSRYPSILTIIG